MPTGQFALLPLGNVLIFRNGKSIKPGGAGEFPIYGSNGVIGGSDEYTEENGVILGRVGAYCGSVAYQRGKFWASDNTIVVYPKSQDQDVHFLSYLLRHLNLNHWAGGAAQPLLTQTVLKKITAPIPHLHIQRKISAILRAYDDLIENNMRRIKILEEMTQNLYHEWFVKFRFPGYENCQFVNSQLGSIPNDWEIVQLRDVANVNRASIQPKNAPNKIQYIDIKSVAPGRIEAVKEMQFSKAPSRARRVVRHGDIIWSTVRPNRRSFALILNPPPNLIVSTGFAVLSATEVPFTFLYQ